MINYSLHLVIIELISNCNLRCKHCYGVFEKKNTIKEKTLKKIVKELRELKCSFVVFSGGEPLLLSDKIFDYASLFRKNKIEVILTTNGTLINRFPIKNFKIFRNVQISLDGPSFTHNCIRGKGSYKKVITAAKLLKKEKVRTSFMTCLHKLNYPYLNKIFNIAQELNMPLGIERFIPMGRGYNEEIKPLNHKELKKVLKFTSKKKLYCNDPLQHFYKSNLYSKKNIKKGGCTAGIATMTITSNLDVLPCTKLRIPVGNLNNNSLKEIWENSQLFNELRNCFNLVKCKDCKYLYICRGCRADAYIKTGNYLEKDPMCWF